MTTAVAVRPRENVAVTFLAVLALTGVVAGAALGPLTSAGLIASLSPARTVGWAVAGAAVAGARGIMVRWRGRSGWGGRRWGRVRSRSVWASGCWG